MYDHSGTVIYVGKANKLRARLRQYFAKTPDPRPFVLTLPQTLSEIRTLSTRTEKEALLLERTLILEHMPKHNVAIKLGSGHLYLKLDMRARWPQLSVTRYPKRDGSRYFGPYLSGSDLRAMTRVIERAFQLRSCDDRDFRNRSRPCLQFQIKRCSGPCVLPVNREQYLDEARGAIRFLEGRHPELLSELQVKMREAATELEYEKAARYRDQIQAIERSLQPQEVAGTRGDHDVIGHYREGQSTQLIIMEIRGGTLLRSRPFPFEDQGADDASLIETFLHLYYSEGTPIPREILVPLDLPHGEALTERLSELRGGVVKIVTPKRGRLLTLLAMAQTNAEHAYFQGQSATQARLDGLVQLKKLLKLNQLPRRMECFDISIFHGEAPFASTVVFEDGAPRRAAYRVRAIESVIGTDDFAMMREAITRRLERGLRGEGDELELPQLLIVDGGKGQLGVAMAVLQDLGLDGIDVIGLAKSRFLGEGEEGEPRHSAERVFLPGIKSPLMLKPGTAPYRLLTQIRDEAHRVAITAHRKRRSQSRLKSPLDEVPGIGMQRRTRLLKTFGSLQGVLEASVRDLASVPGISEPLAERIFRAFRDEYGQV